SAGGPAAPPAMQSAQQAVERARQALARYVGADPGEIALTQNTTEGINIVAAGLDWNAGDEVVITDLEHVAGIAPWKMLAERRGVRAVVVRSEDGSVDP